MNVAFLTCPWCHQIEGNCSLCAVCETSCASKCPQLKCSSCGGHGCGSCPYSKLGDVNGDNQVNINDALQTLMFVAGMPSSTLNESEANLQAALITDKAKEDGEPTINDALQILMYVANMPSSQLFLQNLPVNKEFSIETQVKIRDDYAVSVNDFWGHVRHSASMDIIMYLGTYGGNGDDNESVAVMIHDDRNPFSKYITETKTLVELPPWVESVAGYTFRYIDSRQVRIWNDGEFYSLTSAYENNLITKSDLGKIHANFLNEKSKHETFLDSFMKWFDWPPNEYLYIKKYLGTYDGKSVVKIGGLSTTQAVWYETVAEYKFTYGEGNRIWVLDDGELHPLSTGNWASAATGAYDSGLLTKEDIHMIWLKYTAKISRSNEK